MLRLQQLTVTALALTLYFAANLSAQPAAMVKDIGTAEADWQSPVLQHMRAAFAQKGRRVDVEDSSGGVMLIESEVHEFFEYPKAAALEKFGARERWLGTLVAVLTARTTRVEGRRS